MRGIGLGSGLSGSRCPISFGAPSSSPWSYRRRRFTETAGGLSFDGGFGSGWGGYSAFRFSWYKSLGPNSTPGAF